MPKTGWHPSWSGWHVMTALLILTKVEVVKTKGSTNFFSFSPEFPPSVFRLWLRSHSNFFIIYNKSLFFWKSHANGNLTLDLNDDFFWFKFTNQSHVNIWEAYKISSDKQLMVSDIGFWSKEKGTDKRTDLWSQDFIIWKINSGQWAGLDWKKRFGPIVRNFWGPFF